MLHWTISAIEMAMDGFLRPLQFFRPDQISIYCTHTQNIWFSEPRKKICPNERRWKNLKQNRFVYRRKMSWLSSFRFSIARIHTHTYILVHTKLFLFVFHSLSLFLLTRSLFPSCRLSLPMFQSTKLHEVCLGSFWVNFFAFHKILPFFQSGSVRSATNRNKWVYMKTSLIISFFHSFCNRRKVVDLISHFTA